MEPGTSEWTLVMNRLEKLEKQNRRMKQIGALALILVVSVLLMGQAVPKKTVDANEFILKDTNGNVRGKFDLNALGPELVLLDEKGDARAALLVSSVLDDARLLLNKGKEGGAALSPNGLHFCESPLKCRASFTDAPSLQLYDPQGKVQAALGVTTDGPGLALTDANGKAQSLLEAGSLKVWGSLNVFDGEGFQTTIGSADLTTPRTGETHKTSAASVVLFDKEKKVLWKAP